MKILQLLLLLVTIVSSSKAQIEFVPKEGFEITETFSIEKDGVLVISAKTYNSGVRALDLFDQNMNLIWADIVEFSANTYLVRHFKTETAFHMIFNVGYKYKSVSVMLEDPKMIVNDLNISISHSIDEFKAIDNVIIMEVSDKKSLYFLNIKTGEERFILFKELESDAKKVTFHEMQVIEESKELIVYTYVKRKKESGYTAFGFNESGNKTFQIPLECEDDSYVISYWSGIKTDKNTYLFSGFMKSNKSTNGIYFGKYTNGKPDFIKLNKFSDFTALNFLQKTDKEHYGSVLHDVKKFQNGYLVIAELYNGVTYPEYTGVLVIKYGDEGEMEMNNAIQYDNSEMYGGRKKMLSVSEDLTEEISLWRISENIVENYKLRGKEEKWEKYDLVKSLPVKELCSNYPFTKVYLTYLYEDNLLIKVSEEKKMGKSPKKYCLSKFEFNP